LLGIRVQSVHQVAVTGSQRGRQLPITTTYVDDEPTPDASCFQYVSCGLRLSHRSAAQIKHHYQTTKAFHCLSFFLQGVAWVSSVLIEAY